MAIVKSNIGKRKRAPIKLVAIVIRRLPQRSFSKYMIPQGRNIATRMQNLKRQLYSRFSQALIMEGKIFQSIQSRTKTVCRQPNLEESKVCKRENNGEKDAGEKLERVLPTLSQEGGGVYQELGQGLRTH